MLAGYDLLDLDRGLQDLPNLRLKSILFVYLSSSGQISAGGDNDLSSRNEATLSHFFLEISPGRDKILTALRRRVIGVGAQRGKILSLIHI